MSDGEDEVPKKGKGTKRKGKKSEGPKRALSAYMYFCQEKRPEVRAANSGAGFAEIGKLLGEMWGKLPEEEKVPYNDLNAKDKARYEKEKAEAPAAEDDDEEGSGKKKKAKKEGKKKKDPNAPKSAPTAYMLFCKEERVRLKEAEPSLSFSDVGKRMGENWKALSDEEKKPYQSQHAKLKKVQDAAKAEYSGKAEPKAKKGKAKKAAAEEEGDDDAAEADADGDDGGDE